MALWPQAIYTWGTTAAERAESWPCDGRMPHPTASFYRGLDVAAEPATVFRWLCQLRAAPYSYDLIDNFGRRSPRRLTPGLEKLESGQRVMSIFRLAEFEPGRSITLTSHTRLFGEIVCTYRVTALEPGRSRLAVKLLVSTRGLLRGLSLRTILAPGDFVMMRRQLLNLARLSETAQAD